MMKRTTLRDIAETAAVSIATVSYVLNDVPGKNISAETRRRVIAAAKELHYTPNNVAKHLRTRRSGCIAVRLSHDLTAPRYHNILQGIRTCLNARQYSILLPEHDERGSLAGCIDACMSGQADGILYIAAQGIGILPEEMEGLRRSEIPVSAIDCMGDVPDVSSVVYDYYASSRIRMERLLAAGFRKFLYIRPSYQNYKETAREQGACSVLLERSDVELTVKQLRCIDQGWLTACDNQSVLKSAQILEEIREYVQDLPADVAVVCYAREVQARVSQVLFAQSLRAPVPGSIQWYQRTIAYQFPHYDAGMEAARSLIDCLDGLGTVRKLSLQPVLENVDPRLFA